MFAISPTDYDWFDFLRDADLNSGINFWTPTPWNIKKMKKGDRLYFMLKAPRRKIGGYGEFSAYKNLSAAQAWDEFGYRNGRPSQDVFFNSIKKYVTKNTIQSGTIFDTTAPAHEIGCVILDNCEFWPDEHFQVISDTKSSDDKDAIVCFEPQIVRIKYYNDVVDPFRETSKVNQGFRMISGQRERKQVFAALRDGQSRFKVKILKIYSNQCCVTGEKIPELMEAAHIQPYVNDCSNHAQNGLLLRVDIHRLYDNNLIFIDRDYRIHVSGFVKNPNYRQYDGRRITLPNVTNGYPSVDALESRRKEFRQ